MARGRDDRDRARAIEVGRRVRSLREGQGLTQEDLATRADVHRAVVGFIERAEREPGITLLWRLADGLGLTMSQLLEGIEVTGPRRRPRG